MNETLVNDPPHTNAARTSADYQSFISDSAGQLLALPDNTISLSSGRAFLALGPHLYQKVQASRERFGLPAEQIYDDLIAAYLAQSLSWSRLFHVVVVRTLAWLWLALRLAYVGLFVVPSASRKPRPLAFAARLKNGPAIAGSAAFPPSGAPDASIVMLSYNRLAYLKNSLESLAKTPAGANAELIVVDNGSTDGSLEYLQQQQRSGQIAKLVLLGENLGISAGYNHGFARADGRSHALMKLDSDILVLSEGWLAAALDFLAFHADVGMVALHQVNHGMLQVLPAQRLGDAQVMEFGDWPCGSAMLVPRRIFRELGWFVEDRELKYVPDDINFYTRVCRKGYRALFLRDVCVYHQFDLDGSLYRRYSRGKPMVRSVQLALQLVRAYDRGEAPLELFYEKYQKRGD